MYCRIVKFVLSVIYLFLFYMFEKKNYFNFSFVLVRVYNDNIVLIYYVINDVNCFY